LLPKGDFILHKSDKLLHFAVHVFHAFAHRQMMAMPQYSRLGREPDWNESSRCKSSS